MNEDKKTFGQQYLEGIGKDSGYANVKEMRAGLLAEWDKNVFEVITNTRKILKTEKFYICVTGKREPQMIKVLKNIFESKYACPTPQFEQTVYRIPEGTHDWQLLWVIPDYDSCIYLKRNALSLPLEERQLLEWVLDFSIGKLDQLAQKENGELIQTIN